MRRDSRRKVQQWIEVQPRKLVVPLLHLRKARHLSHPEHTRLPLCWYGGLLVYAAKCSRRYKYT